MRIKNIQTLNIYSKQKASGNTDAFFVKQPVCSIPDYSISAILKQAKMVVPKQIHRQIFPLEMSHCMRGCKQIFSSFNIKEYTSIYAEKRDLFIEAGCKQNKQIP